MTRSRTQVRWVAICWLPSELRLAPRTIPVVPDWGRLVAAVAGPDLEAWGRREVGQGIGAHHRGEWVMAGRKSLRSQKPSEPSSARSQI
jgi:hypothetical protein